MRYETKNHITSLSSNDRIGDVLNVRDGQGRVVERWEAVSVMDGKVNREVRYRAHGYRDVSSL